MFVFLQVVLPINRSLIAWFVSSTRVVSQSLYSQRKPGSKNKRVAAILPLSGLVLLLMAMPGTTRFYMSLKTTIFYTTTTNEPIRSNNEACVLFKKFRPRISFRTRKSGDADRLDGLNRIISFESIICSTRHTYCRTLRGLRRQVIWTRLRDDTLAVRAQGHTLVQTLPRVATLPQMIH